MPKEKETKEALKEEVKSYKEECEENRRATAEWWFKHDPAYAKLRGFYLDQVDVMLSD